MPTTDGYNGAYTGPEIDKGIARANQAVTVPGSGTASMSETLGSGPYTIEFTEEADPQDVSASKIAYDNTESGMTATNVQNAITELSTRKRRPRRSGRVCILAGGTDSAGGVLNLRWKRGKSYRVR